MVFTVYRRWGVYKGGESTRGNMNRNFVSLVLIIVLIVSLFFWPALSSPLLGFTQDRLLSPQPVLPVDRLVASWAVVLDR